MLCMVKRLRTSFPAACMNALGQARLHDELCDAQVSTQLEAVASRIICVAKSTQDSFLQRHLVNCTPKSEIERVDKEVK